MGVNYKGRLLKFCLHFILKELDNEDLKQRKILANS